MMMERIPDLPEVTQPESDTAGTKTLCVFLKKGSCCDLCQRVFFLCFPLRVKQIGSDEPRGSTGVKDADVENGLEARGGRRVSWDEARE